MRSGDSDDGHLICKFGNDTENRHGDTELFLQGTNTPSLIPTPEWLHVKYLPLNLGTVAAILYMSLYILMEPVAGGMLAPLLLGGTAYVNHLTSAYGKTANYWAIGLHVMSWLFQFIGHGLFEGRAPALLDNLVQALFLAPFFVWMEILFYFGYRPELRQRLNKAVHLELEKFRKSKVQENGAAVNGKADRKAL